MRLLYRLEMNPDTAALQISPTIKKALPPVDNYLLVRRESAKWKCAKAPLGIQVPNEPLELSIMGHLIV